VCPSVQALRLRQKWIDPHFIRCGIYAAVASTIGRADHQEWIVPRSIARCGLDIIASSHQDPICKPCARSPLRSSATLASKLVMPRSLRYLAPSCMLREGGYDVRCAILQDHCSGKHRHLQWVEHSAKDHARGHSCCCGHSVSGPINAIAASAFPHDRELPPSCLVADPLFIIRRKQSARRPSNRSVMRLAV